MKLKFIDNIKLKEYSVIQDMYCGNDCIIIARYDNYITTGLPKRKYTADLMIYNFKNKIKKRKYVDTPIKLKVFENLNKMIFINRKPAAIHFDIYDTYNFELLESYNFLDTYNYRIYMINNKGTALIKHRKYGLELFNPINQYYEKLNYCSDYLRKTKQNIKYAFLSDDDKYVVLQTKNDILLVDLLNKNILSVRDYFLPFVGNSLEAIAICGNHFIWVSKEDISLMVFISELNKHLQTKFLTKVETPLSAYRLKLSCDDVYHCYFTDKYITVHVARVIGIASHIFNSSFAIYDYHNNEILLIKENLGKIIGGHIVSLTQLFNGLVILASEKDLWILDLEGHLEKLTNFKNSKIKQIYLTPDEKHLVVRKNLNVLSLFEIQQGD